MRQAASRVIDSHPIVWYTLARVALLLLVMVPLALAGVRGLWLFVAAFLVSGAMSLFLLDGMRARFSGRMSGYFTRLNRRIDESARAEDFDDDEAPGEPSAQSPSAGQGQSQA